MNPPPWKRVRYFAIYRTSNDHGEWTVRVEPGGLQIDTFHEHGTPHLHHPGDYDHRIRLRPMPERRAADIIQAHLQRRGEIDLDALLKELNEG